MPYALLKRGIYYIIINLTIRAMRARDQRGLRRTKQKRRGCNARRRTPHGKRTRSTHGGKNRQPDGRKGGPRKDIRTRRSADRGPGPPVLRPPVGGQLHRRQGAARHLPAELAPVPALLLRQRPAAPLLPQADRQNVPSGGGGRRRDRRRPVRRHPLPDPRTPVHGTRQAGLSGVDLRAVRPAAPLALSRPVPRMAHPRGHLHVPPRHGPPHLGPLRAPRQRGGPDGPVRPVLRPSDHRHQPLLRSMRPHQPHLRAVYGPLAADAGRRAPVREAAPVPLAARAAGAGLRDRVLHLPLLPCANLRSKVHQAQPRGDPDEPRIRVRPALERHLPGRTHLPQDAVRLPFDLPLRPARRVGAAPEAGAPS